ncbi:hypothetical protein VTN49DRAFT_2938 [Thermomyces lanuginosus]|uniref:uncharacterized protein n=1 Tax=Thermomyces lanuginosus TaxID=5541 RepID=UPI003744A686
MGLSFSKPSASAEVPTDTVLPLSYLDQQKVYRRMRLQCIRLVVGDGKVEETGLSFAIEFQRKAGVPSPRDI